MELLEKYILLNVNDLRSLGMERNFLCKELGYNKDYLSRILRAYKVNKDKKRQVLLIRLFANLNKDILKVFCNDKYFVKEYLNKEGLEAIGKLYDRN